MKKQNGITLVSLVITIIVMLILAGVSLSMVMGEGSLIDQATSATNNTRGADVKEYVELAVSSNKVGKYSGIGIKNRTTVIEELLEQGKITSDEKTYLDTNEILVIGDISIDFSVINESLGITVNTTPVYDSSIAVAGPTINGTTAANYAVDNQAYPVQINTISDVSSINFYKKLASEADTAYAPAEVMWAVSKATIGTSMTAFASAYDYVAFKLPDIDSIYTLKVEYVLTDGSVKYFTCTTPEGLCFVAGTEVLTENGLVNIEDITAGMKVYSMNFETGENELKTVLSVSENIGKVDIYSIDIGEECIESTDVHPYYEKTKGFIAAKDLEIGDVLVDVDGNDVVIENITVTTTENEISVYNMNVEDNHNYYVSEKNILVHNAGCPT